MTCVRRLTAVPALAVVSLISAFSLAPIAGTAATPVQTVARTANPVSMQVVSTSPTTPQITSAAMPYTVVLALTNETGAAIPNITITGLRGDPVQSQTALDGAFTSSKPTTSANPIVTAKPVTAALPAGGTTLVTFTTSTSTLVQPTGICLCAPDGGVYPLYFTAHDGSADGTTLGTTTTWMPGFDRQPTPQTVAWLWPLIDRPHRLTSAKTFTDDSLAAEVADGGRLSRALAVPERLPDSIPLTLLVDPELLAELEVMATGNYEVQVGDRTVAGTGGPDATAWLDRFRLLLEDHPNIAVQLTPYADPDVQTLSARRLSWSADMPAAMATDVRAALSGRPVVSTVSWPVATRISTSTLRTLAGDGVRTVVLDSASVKPADGANGAPPVGLARLSAGAHTVAAALTSSTIEKTVASVLTANEAGTSALPQLAAQVAIRTVINAVANTGAAGTLVLTAPRYVDTDPTVAVRAIKATTSSVFTQAAKVSSATALGRTPRTSRQLVAPTDSAAALPNAVADSAVYVAGQLPALASLLDVASTQAQSGTASTRPSAGSSSAGSPASTVVTGSQLRAALQVGLQRVESSYWRTDPTLGASQARSLTQQVDALLSGVRIISPSSGIYTLASGNSPLPVTVENDLAYPVRIRIRITTVNDLPGFRIARDVGVTTISPRSKQTLHLPTVIQRSGRIPITAQLLTPDHQSLGGVVALSVHSTALGTVGVVITVVAGGVLVLALLIRIYRRLRGRRKGGRNGGRIPAHSTGRAGPARVSEPTS